MLTSACPISTPPCNGNEGLDEGQRVRVTFVARYVPDGEYLYRDNFLSNRWSNLRGCDGLDGVGPGTSLEMQAVDGFLVTETCIGRAMKVESGPPGLVLGEYQRPFNVPSSLAANHLANFGGCGRRWTVWFKRTSPSATIFAPPVPGQIPPMVAAREILNSDPENTPSSCQPCSDEFVVHLEKQ